MDEGTFERTRRGDAEALATLYREIATRFSRLLADLDVNDAQDVLHEAFAKLLDAMQQGKLSWKSEAGLLRYCRTTVRNEKINFMRKRGLIMRELPEDDARPEPDPEKEQGQARFWTQLYQEALGVCSPQERRILEAYVALSMIPGSERWTKHQRTKYVRNAVGLTPSAFWPAHSRFCKKMAKLLLERNLLRKNGKGSGGCFHTPSAEPKWGERFKG